MAGRVKGLQRCAVIRVKLESANERHRSPSTAGGYVDLRNAPLQTSLDYQTGSLIGSHIEPYLVLPEAASLTTSAACRSGSLISLLLYSSSLAPHVTPALT